MSGSWRTTASWHMTTLAGELPRHSMSPCATSTATKVSGLYQHLFFAVVLGEHKRSNHAERQENVEFLTLIDVLPDTAHPNTNTSTSGGKNCHNSYIGVGSVVITPLSHRFGFRRVCSSASPACRMLPGIRTVPRNHPPPWTRSRSGTKIVCVPCRCLTICSCRRCTTIPL